MKVNLCRREGPISFCRAKNRAAQENCTYSKSSDQADRCMYLKFEEYCDNYWAQINKIPPDSKLKENKSAKYEPCEGCSYAKSCLKRATRDECDEDEKKKQGVEAFK